MRRQWRPGGVTVPAVIALLTGLACSDAPGGDDGDGSDGGALPGDGGLPTLDAAGQGGPTPDAVPPGEPCDPDPCPNGAQCVANGNEAECVPVDCDTLLCEAGEICQTVPDGAICVVERCESDLVCPEDQFCGADGQCVADFCAADTRSCDPGPPPGILACAENGSMEAVVQTCVSLAPGYGSTCVSPVPGDAACTCRDAWDCEAFLVCDGGECRGTGEPPLCRLDPVPLDRALPAPEIVWGGTADSTDADGSPFPESSQAVMTPVVANLDDDNGDGIIDERDFPEILFMTFCGSSFSSNGALRAIEGGGPNKGRDKFAVLGQRVWRAGEPLPDGGSYACGDGRIDPTASLAVGDLDDPANSDGRPEIVAVHRNDDSGIVVFDHTGAPIFEGFVGQLGRAGGNPAIALANVDGEGPAEIVIGPYVLTIGRDADGNLVAGDRFRGNAGRGTNGQGAIGCVADVLGDARLEIVAGGTVYQMPNPPAGATRQADCAQFAPQTPEEEAWCAGELLVAWETERGTQDGFCAVADVLGADPDAPPSPTNPPDGLPEVILISDGSLVIHDGATGAVRLERDIGAGRRGGAPNVDDFDGDGLPEIGSAFETAYVMMDLQAPGMACPAWPAAIPDTGDAPPENPLRDPGGACVEDVDCGEGAFCGLDQRCLCLHNGWARQTEDDSSRVTGSTLFDFNGDGAAEVIYNDECWFRIYDGRTGAVLFKEPSESRTRIEHPIVADVDNDGNAEIAFTVSNESGFCSERGDPAPAPLAGSLADLYNNGLEVWGDPNDQWVSARRIWNQHSYHVTQVTEAGRVPQVEPPSWGRYNGRQYNTYRSQPRSFGVAPNLVVAEVQIASPDASCGTLTETVDIVARIANIGDLRVGPGVVVLFEGAFGDDVRTLTGPDGAPLRIELVESLEPGDSTRLTRRYDTRANGDDPDRLPDRVRVRVDAEGDPEFGRERECNEMDNEAEVETNASDARPDLRLDSVEAIPLLCPGAVLRATLTNTSEIAAEQVRVRFYAGDPDRGAPALGETVLERVEPGETVTAEVEVEELVQDREIVVHAVVDPDDRIAECNDADNAGRADPILCLIP